MHYSNPARQSTKMRSKKAQTKMLETITVIIVFFILIAFGFVFYANMQKNALTNQIQEIKNAKALKTAKIALSLPELQCNGKTYCFDSTKIKAFSESVQARNNYFDLFRYSTITINRIYPLSQNPAENIVVVYNNRNPTMASKQQMWIPVALYEPLYGKTNFAVLTVDVYE